MTCSRCGCKLLPNEVSVGMCSTCWHEAQEREIAPQLIIVDNVDGPLLDYDPTLGWLLR